MKKKGQANLSFYTCCFSGCHPISRIIFEPATYSSLCTSEPPSPGPYYKTTKDFSPRVAERTGCSHPLHEVKVFKVLTCQEADNNGNYLGKWFRIGNWVGSVDVVAWVRISILLTCNTGVFIIVGIPCWCPSQVWSHCNQYQWGNRLFHSLNSLYVPNLFLRHNL